MGVTLKEAFLREAFLKEAFLQGGLFGDSPHIGPHMYTCIKCKQLVLDLFVKHTPKCYISDGLILLKVGFFRISKLVTPSSIGFFLTKSAFLWGKL